MAVRIKICGITRCEDAELAVSLGADMIGLNFYPPSPRCLTIERASAIARALKGRARLVGIFVNAERAYIKEHFDSLKLDLLQFHGDEDDAAMKGWPVAVIRALRLRADAALGAIRIDKIKADYVLIDTFHSELFGGTGRSRRLDTLRALDLRRVFVSGGLAPDNVAEAAALNPYALDVASGVESAPGLKDADKLASFIANAESFHTNKTSSGANKRSILGKAGASRAGAKLSR
jgi:phosphoribosylanthranilate isomerase